MMLDVQVKDESVERREEGVVAISSRKGKGKAPVINFP